MTPFQGARPNAVSTLLTTIADDLVTTFFPASCHCCAAPLRHASSVPVCRACLAALTPSTLTACFRCGDALAEDLAFEDLRTLPAETLCRACRLAPPAFARAVSFATYTAQLRELIGLLKFHHVPAVAALLAPHLAEAILSLEHDAAPSLLVVAVPLFPARQRQRGYNQSILLAASTLKHLRRLRPAWQLTPAHTVLRRQRSTESSFLLDRRSRRRNLRGAFALTPGARPLIAGREVLLIDDIFTSGATARECARVLARAGAAKVWVATVARAQQASVLNYQQEAATTAIWTLNPATLPEE